MIVNLDPGRKFTRGKPKMYVPRNGIPDKAGRVSVIYVFPISGRKLSKRVPQERFIADRDSGEYSVHYTCG